MQYVVVTIYNTDEHGAPVPEDVPEDDMPRTLVGPFESAGEARHWMDYVYPDGDTDVHEQFYEPYEPADKHAGYINHPDSITSG